MSYSRAPAVPVPNTVYNPSPNNPAIYEQPKLMVKNLYLQRFRAQHERGLRALDAYAASTGDRGRAQRAVRDSEAWTEETDAEQELHEGLAQDEDEDEDFEYTEGQRREAAVLQHQYATAETERETPLPKFFPSPAPPLGSIRPLSMPVAIPQVIHSMIHSPFQRVYAEVLAEAGVSKQDFGMFIKGMNEAVAESPVFMVLGLTSLVTGFIQTATTQIISNVTNIVAEAGRRIQSKGRADAFLEHANDIFFRPRGLVCTVVTDKIKEELFANAAPMTQVAEVHLPSYDESLGLPRNEKSSYLHATPSFSTNSRPGPSSSSVSLSPPVTYAPLTPLGPPPTNVSAPAKFFEWAVDKGNKLQASRSKRADEKLAKELEKERAKGQKKVDREIRRGKGEREVKREMRRMEHKLKRVEKKRGKKAKSAGPFWLVVLNDPDAPVRATGPRLQY